MFSRAQETNPGKKFVYDLKETLFATLLGYMPRLRSTTVP